MTRITTILLVVALGAGCDMDLVQGFEDLVSIRDGVIRVMKCIRAVGRRANLKGAGLSGLPRTVPWATS